MNVIDIHQTVKLTLAVAEHEYEGKRDRCQFRNGDGEEVWQKGQWHQQYTGQFLQDCLHNYGTYVWRNIDACYQHTYVGKFFANNVEGYGVLSYPDGKIFEGLFKANKRYGPGILTHTDGSQDVGLWDGNCLVRLNTNLPKKSIPQLAQTVHGKAYLLNYKDLVPVQEKLQSIANEILSGFQADETILQNSEILYSKFVHNSNSVFFNRRLYYDNYFDNEADWTINVVDSYDNDQQPIITKIDVTHLLAWNNEQLAIAFMKHAFLHRNYEPILSYNVCDILTGQRTLFKSTGHQEALCLELLESCCLGDETIVTKLICKHDLNADLSDFQGNNGIIYAATYDQTRVIKTLTNLGANVDSLNDECLTALSMSILRYTAYKYDVEVWEHAFLPSNGGTEYNPEIQKWRSNDHITVKRFEIKDKYFFDLSCVHPEKKSRGKKDEKKPKEGRQKKDKIKEIEPEIIEDPKTQHLEEILDTIICLLQCGAKPNYGDCPFPPLILSIFARSSDIVYQLINFGANTNVRTSYHLGSLCPLHIIASLAPSLELVAMASVLLANGADPNLTANTIHWVDESTIILAGVNTVDYGKTPLQLLCMRYDFIDDVDDCLGELCDLLINLGADPNMDYLGHTSLTLAIIRGNVRLMKHILNSGLVNPNQSLGNGMGVPLTALILKRYENILPVNICEQIFNCLLEYYANPLNNVPGFEGNTIEFNLQENFVKETNTPKSAKSNKSEKGGKKIKGHQLIIQLLYDAAEITLVKRIQRKVVQILYQYKIECDFDDPIFDVIVKYIDVETTVKYLQILLDNDVIIPCKTFCYYLLEFVNSKIKKKAEKKKKVKTGIPQNEMDNLTEELDYSQTIDRAKQFVFQLFMPEMDPDDTKFIVCFECFQKTNKTLILCPKCQLVYFCSQECNIKNMKKKTTKHPCNFLFYNNELQLMKERIAMGLPAYPDNIFDGFKTLREKLIAESPDYFDRIKNYDERMTAGRMKEREEREREAAEKALKGKKGKQKSRSTSRTGKRSRSSSSDESGRRGKSRGKGSEKGKGGKSRGKSSEKGKRRKSRGKSKKGKKGKKGRRSSASSAEGRRHKKKKGKHGKSPDKSKKSKKKDLEAKGKSGMLDKTDKGLSADDKGRPSDGQAGDRYSKAALIDETERYKFGTDFGSEEFQDSVSDICHNVDYKFFQMILPYCVFIDGQLYYKFDNLNTFYKLTYSNV